MSAIFVFVSILVTIFLLRVSIGKVSVLLWNKSPNIQITMLSSQDFMHPFFTSNFLSFWGLPPDYEWTRAHPCGNRVDSKMPSTYLNYTVLREIDLWHLVTPGSHAIARCSRKDSKGLQKATYYTAQASLTSQPYPCPLQLESWLRIQKLEAQGPSNSYL
jgi:hypothetical protein